MFEGNVAEILQRKGGITANLVESTSTIFKVFKCTGIDVPAREGWLTQLGLSPIDPDVP